MGLLPVPRNVDAAADPDLLMLLDMVQKALQRHDAAGPSQQAAMHAHAQHLGCVQASRRAFGIERVKAVAQVGKEVVGLGKALGQRKAHVVSSA
jgi:hypothetical protein